MVMTLVNRCDNVTDSEKLAKLDAVLAKWAPRWMKMSGPKLTERIEMWVEKFDPAGLRERRSPSADRYVDIGPTTPGRAGVWASLTITEGATLDDRLDNVAKTVCEDDPRDQRERRADVLMALAAGQAHLECGCGSPECPAAAVDGKPLAQVVLHLVAEQATMSGTSESPGYMPGYGAVPAMLVRELADSAKLKPIVVPPPAAEPRYRPSAALADFIRWRDLTCRWPSCDVRASKCELDHTVAYPVGPTHPSNLKLYCPHHRRAHHRRPDHHHQPRRPPRRHQQ